MVLKDDWIDWDGTGSPTPGVNKMPATTFNLIPTQVNTNTAKLAGIEPLADVTDAANVDAAGAVMNTDTSTAAMSFVIDEDSMATNTATQVPTQQSVKAYVDAHSGGSGATTQESTYVITKVGSTITATPRSGSGVSSYTGTDAYTVIQNAINALTPSGGSGSGGGKIHICAGDYGLSNELTIHGWEGIVASNSQPYSQLIIEGDGMTTYVYQTTSGKNTIKINNCANVTIRDMKLYSGTNAKSCLLGDNDGATSVMSMWKGEFDNLHCHSDATGYPAVLIKDFFEIAVPWMRVYSTQNTGVVLQQTDTLVKRGNSWIGSLVSASSSSSPHAGLKLECTTSSSVIDMITIDNYQCTTPSYYGIYLYGAQYNNFLFTDIESAFYCVYADGPTSGSYQYSSNNTFYSGYWQPANNGEGFHGTTHAFANTIAGVAIYTRGDGTVKAINDLNTGNASDYKINMPNPAAPDLAANFIGYSGTRLQIIANGSSYTEKIPNVSVTGPNGANTTAVTVTQNDTTNNPRGVSITNAGTNNALYVKPNANTSTSDSSGGAVLVDTSSSTGIGVNIYNRNASSGRLFRLLADSLYQTTVNGGQTLTTASTTLTVASTSGWATSGTVIVQNSTSNGENNKCIFLHYTSITATTIVGTAGTFYTGASVTLVTNAVVRYLNASDTQIKMHLIDWTASGGAANLKLASPNPDIELTAIGFDNSIGQGQFELDIPVGDVANSANVDVFRINGRNDANSSFVTNTSWTRPGTAGKGMVGIGFSNQTTPTTMAAHLHIKNDTSFGDTNAAALPGQIIQGAASQTANLLEFRPDGSTTPLASVSSAGVGFFPSIELGNASDTTLTRSSAGRVSVEGKVLALDFATTFADVNMSGSPAQTVATGAFTKLNMNTETSDAGNNYDAVTNFVYTIPTSGIYEFFAMVRISDSTTVDMNLGIGIHTSAIDGVWVEWIPIKTTAQASRAAYQYLRKVNASAGSTYQLNVYCDAAASVGIKSAQMTAMRIA